jgi:uncharacterized protein (DUF58 family)
VAYLERSLGAYADLAHLASYQLPARYLPLRNNQRALNHLAGPYRSMIRGRGMEFEEVRQYQPGDDIRSMDWRVTARTGIAHTKRYREEREKPILVVIDQRQNMFFGSEYAMKSLLASDLAAYIAWAAFHKGDKIGGMIFNDTTQQEIRPRRQQKTVLQLLHHLVNFNTALNSHPVTGKRPISDALKELRRVAKPGSQIFFISDFHDLGEECSALLHDVSRHCELIALQTFDRLEEQLPVAGIYSATNGQQQIRFDSSNALSRERYHNDFVAHCQRLKNLFGKFNIPLIPVATRQAPLDVLQQYFGTRQ